jgi:regulator of protease activity HflC (stomatin/prohibitin superfamily)
MSNSIEADTTTDAPMSELTPTPTTPANLAPPEPMPKQNAAVAQSLAGLGTQALLAAAVLVLAQQGNAVGALADYLMPMTFLGLLVWASVVIAAVLRKARATEAFELEAARRGGESVRTIFDSELDAAPAARRLEKFLSFGVPVIAAVVGLGLLVFGALGLRGVLGLDWSRVSMQRSNIAAGVAGGAAFVGFVAGFYLLGVGAQTKRPLIRGAAVYLLGTVILFAVVAAAAAARAAIGIEWVSLPVAIILTAVTFLVGTEILLNLVLELYRPATSGETLDDHRPAYNPRIIEVIVSPGGVARQLNEAFRYQFGFEVTQSWFAGVLKRSAAGLLLIGAIVLVVLSSIVVVHPHQGAVVTTFGKLDDEPLQPGVHLKWPWPISTAEVADTGRVRKLMVGTESHGRQHDFYFWQSQHTGDEGLFILGARGVGEDDEAGPAVSLAAADLTVLWRVAAGELHEFVTGYADPVIRLEILARQALSMELAQYDIDAAIGARRVDVARAIERRLRDAVEAEPLGIEVLSVGLNSIRPPEKVAASFNETVAAEQRKLQAIAEGQAQAESRLSVAAGSPETARQIADRIEALPESGQGADLESEALIIDQIRRSGGEAANRLLVARGNRYVSEANAQGRTARALALADAYSRASEIIGTRLKLRAIGEALASRAKTFYLTDAPIHLEFEGEQGSGILGGDGLEIPQ